jgi:hypothetical protein
LLFVGLFVGILWLTTLIMLWPVLHAHYGGLPQTLARVMTMLGWLLSFAVYGVALMLLYRLMTGPISLSTPALSLAPSARRAILVGGIGVLVVAASGGMLWRLYR